MFNSGRRGRFWNREVCQVSEDNVGPDREAWHKHSCQRDLHHVHGVRGGVHRGDDHQHLAIPAVWGGATICQIFFIELLTRMQEEIQWKILALQWWKQSLLLGSHWNILSGKNKGTMLYMVSMQWLVTKAILYCYHHIWLSSYMWWPWPCYVGKLFHIIWLFPLGLQALQRK